MEAIGYNVTAHRIAAYAFAALIAAVGGVLLVWQNNQISPFSVGVDVVINILIIAVVGGLGHPIGAFIGAFIYVILRTFALDALVAVGLDGRRFQTLIGLGFLIIVLFSPDGVIGLWRRWSARAAFSAAGAATVSTIAERMAAAGTGNAIELRGVSRYFGALAALTDITLSVAAGRAPRRARIERRRQDDFTQLRDRRFSADVRNRAFFRRGCNEDCRRTSVFAAGLRRTYQISLLFSSPHRARECLSRLPRRFTRSLFLHSHQSE